MARGVAGGVGASKTIVYNYGGPQLSRQNQKTSRQKQNTSRQNQNPRCKILHSKNQIPHGKSKYPWQNQSYFVFAVKLWFCREVFGFAATVVGHHVIMD